MLKRRFPVIDPVATGQNIVRLRLERGLSVRDIQTWFNFEEPRAIYKWQSGKSLPTVDNLYALSALFDVSMDDILISTDNQASFAGMQGNTLHSAFLCALRANKKPCGAGLFICMAGIGQSTIQRTQLLFNFRYFPAAKYREYRFPARQCVHL